MMRSLVLVSMVAVALGGCDANDFAKFKHDGAADDDAGGGTDDGGTTGGEDAGPPPKRVCGTDFKFHPATPVTSVGIGGEFDGWKPEMQPMTGPDANGDYAATVMLPPGSYGYKLVTRSGTTDTWLIDPSNPYTKWVGGSENSVVEVDDCHAPRIDYKKLDKDAAGTVHAEIQYVDGTDGAGLDPASLAVLLDDQPAPGLKIRSDGFITIDATGLAKDKHRVVVRAADLAGHHAVDLTVPFWIEDKDFQFTDGTMYFVFTDRFQNGNATLDQVTSGVDPRANYEGGDWAGVKQAIDGGYFDSLGVRTIWLSPPNANPDGSFNGLGGHLYTGYHGYWPSSGREPQKRFGDLDALKALVRSAHAHGIRVIIDSVLNHVHQESAYWTQHQNDGWFNPFTINSQSCQCGAGPANGCGDWDSTQPSGNHGFVARMTCWFEPYMPDLDYTNWDALTTMIDDAIYWAREADIDGFRVDAVKHFLLTATTRLRGKLHDEFEHAQPLFYLVGETFTGDRALISSFMGARALHAQFDFPIYFALRGALASYTGTMRDVEGAAKGSDQAFGDAPMSPFFGNHDVTRFLSEAAGMLTSDPQGQAWSAPPGAPPDDSAYQKLQLALSFVLTSPGVPLIYYGDEYGQPGAADPDNRRFMKWSGYSASESATLAHAKRLGAARAELVALQRGNRVTMWIDDNLYVYARTTGSSVAVVVINREWNARTVSVPVAAGVPLPDGTILHDRLGGPDLTVAGQHLALSIPAHSSAVFAP